MAKDWDIRGDGESFSRTISWDELQKSKQGVPPAVVRLPRETKNPVFWHSPRWNLPFARLTARHTAKLFAFARSQAAAHIETAGGGELLRATPFYNDEYHFALGQIIRAMPGENEPVYARIDLSALSDEGAQAVAADRAARFRANLDDAVRHAALNYSRFTTEDLGWIGARLVERWNAKADEIDATYGKGFFGLRMEDTRIFCKLPRPPRQSKLDERGPGVSPAFRFVAVNPGGYARAMSVLLFLSASNPDDATIQWMLDVLDVVPLPEKRIIRAAKDKNGLWDRRLRK